jgi:hypothetical protein
MFTPHFRFEIVQGSYPILTTIIFIYAQEDVLMAEEIDEIKHCSAPQAIGQPAAFVVNADGYKYFFIQWICPSYLFRL